MASLALSLTFRTRIYPKYSRGVGQITIEAVRIETDELGALYLYVTSGLIGNSSDGNYYRYGIIDSITALE